MPGTFPQSQYLEHVVLFQAFFPFNAGRHAASVSMYLYKARAPNEDLLCPSVQLQFRLQSQRLIRES